MQHEQLVRVIADILKGFDAEFPVHKNFRAGIGPYGEPQVVRELAKRLNKQGIKSKTHRTPDLGLDNSWAIEFKIIRPFGDNGREAENWSQNLLHPYKGNVSLIGDALKLMELDDYSRKCLFAIGFEHHPPMIGLDVLLRSFELIARDVVGIPLGGRVEETRSDLVHPVHQVLRCVSWELAGT